MGGIIFGSVQRSYLAICRRLGDTGELLKPRELHCSERFSCCLWFLLLLTNSPGASLESYKFVLGWTDFSPVACV